MTKLHSESISDTYIFISSTIPLDGSSHYGCTIPPDESACSVFTHHVVNKLKNIIEDIDHRILNFKCEMCVCLIITTTISISAFAMSLYNLTI